MLVCNGVKVGEGGQKGEARREKGGKGTDINIIRRIDHQYRSIIRHHAIAIIPILYSPIGRPRTVREEIRSRRCIARGRRRGNQVGDGVRCLHDIAEIVEAVV